MGDPLAIIPSHIRMADGSVREVLDKRIGPDGKISVRLGLDPREKIAINITRITE